MSQTTTHMPDPKQLQQDLISNLKQLREALLSSQVKCTLLRRKLNVEQTYTKTLRERLDQANKLLCNKAWGKCDKSTEAILDFLTLLWEQEPEENDGKVRPYGNLRDFSMQVSWPHSDKERINELDNRFGDIIGRFIDAGRIYGRNSTVDRTGIAHAMSGPQFLDDAPGNHEAGDVPGHGDEDLPIDPEMAPEVQPDYVVR